MIGVGIVHERTWTYDFTYSERARSMSDPNDAIQSLSRIAQAASRLMAHMHFHGKLIDLKEEVDHMQANLNHVRKELAESRTIN